MKFPDSPHPAPPGTPTPAEIRARAHQIWLLDGKPQGAEMEHWLEAEHQLQLEYAKRPKLSESGKIADAKELVSKVAAQLHEIAPRPTRSSPTSVDGTH